MAENPANLTQEPIEEGVEWAWENRKLIRRWLGRIYEWYRGDSTAPIPDEGRDERYILIVGSGGVGKTTLAEYLRGDYEECFFSPGSYNESLNEERGVYTDRLHNEIGFIIPPGQVRRR